MKNIFYFSFICLTFVQCNFFDSTDEVPMFIRLSEANLTTKINEGSANHAIVDVWVFADGNELGVFELPMDVPVLDLNNDGTTELTIFAGVRSNGIKSDATLYPFYEKLVFNFDFVEREIKALDLNFSYLSNSKFELLEDFESGNLFGADIDEDPETVMVIDNQNAASGTSSARIDMPVDGGQFEGSTLLYSDRSKITTGSRVFLELEYKNDIELQVGLITIEGNLEFKNYKLVLRTQEEWNKVYIDFSNELVNSNINAYRVVFGVVNPTDEDKVVYIDNVKLLHF